MKDDDPRRLAARQLDELLDTDTDGEVLAAAVAQLQLEAGELERTDGAE